MYRSSVAWKEAIAKAINFRRCKQQVGDKSAYVWKAGAEKESVLICYSYRTPIAYDEDGKVYATTMKFSITTAKHLREFIVAMGLPVIYVSQHEIDKMEIRS